MTKRIFFILSLLICVLMQVYSANYMRFTYDERNILLFRSIAGFDFPHFVHSYGTKDEVYRIEVFNDTCIDILIEESNLLERDSTILERKTGLDVRMQLILEKPEYGYDILNFCRYADDSFGVELNGKLMRKSIKWSLFIKYLIDYHQKYKKITHQSLSEILRKCDMIKW